MGRREEFYKGHKRIELAEGPSGVPIVEETGGPPEYLYRSMAHEEWDDAQRQGFLQSKGDDRGAGRVFASPWADPRYAGSGNLTVRIKYSPEDNWRTRWAGEDLTAVADKVPLNRVQLHSINPVIPPEHRSH